MTVVAKGANMALMFFLELGVYLAAGYWAFTAAPSGWALPAAVALPLLFAVVWGVFGAPKARVPLRGVARAALEIVWFGGGVAAAFAAGLPAAAAVFAALFLLNAVLRVVWRQV
ncbi:YrdB family protein [Sphaerisporangium sp. B11E5]|uniref:YrdB family protein n=1 Tax=Sphaerisporangium sp. B11E5 TaxID=3153563 RepID=UPI00325D3F54